MPPWCIAYNVKKSQWRHRTGPHHHKIPSIPAQRLYILHCLKLSLPLDSGDLHGSECPHLGAQFWAGRRRAVEWDEWCYWYHQFYHRRRRPDRAPQAHPRARSQLLAASLPACWPQASFGVAPRLNRSDEWTALRYHGQPSQCVLINTVLRALIKQTDEAGLAALTPARRDILWAVCWLVDHALVFIYLSH